MRWGWPQGLEPQKVSVETAVESHGLVGWRGEKDERQGISGEDVSACRRGLGLWNALL